MWVGIEKYNELALEENIKLDQFALAHLFHIHSTKHVPLSTNLTVVKPGHVLQSNEI